MLVHLFKRSPGLFLSIFVPSIAFWMLTYWFGLFSGSSPAFPPRTAPLPFFVINKYFLKRAFFFNLNLVCSSCLPLTRHSGGAEVGEGLEKEGCQGVSGEEWKTVTEQGRSRRSCTVREVGWEGQEKMWGEPLQEGQRRKEDCHEQGRSRTVREVGWEGQEKMWGKPLQEGQRGQREEIKTAT